MDLPTTLDGYDALLDGCLTELSNNAASMQRIAEWCQKSWNPDSTEQPHKYAVDAVLNLAYSTMRAGLVLDGFLNVQDGELSKLDLELEVLGTRLRQANQNAGQTTLKQMKRPRNYHNNTSSKKVQVNLDPVGSYKRRPIDLRVLDSVGTCLHPGNVASSSTFVSFDDNSSGPRPAPRPQPTAPERAAPPAAAPAIGSAPPPPPAAGNFPPPPPPTSSMGAPPPPPASAMGMPPPPPAAGMGLPPPPGPPGSFPPPPANVGAPPMPPVGQLPPPPPPPGV